MKYAIYEGALGEIRRVIFEGEGSWEDAMDHVKLLGKHPDKYCRLALIDGCTHVDFGSWSMFIKFDGNLTSFED